MLRWRLLLGFLAVGFLIGLIRLEQRTEYPGLYLFPVFMLFAVMAADETLGLLSLAKITPSRILAWAGCPLLVASAWALEVLGFLHMPKPPMGGFGPLLLSLAILEFIAFFSETQRFERPGGSVSRLAGTTLAFVYVGVMGGILFRLRIDFGVAAFVSLFVVAKMGDIGAYTIGRIFGRRKMAPKLSPGKTMEGAAGAVVCGLLGAGIMAAWLAPILQEPEAVAWPWWRWLIYGLIISVAGMIADLSESLLKREAGSKDSSTWLPGFGGVLDLLDSLLLTAPVAYLCWMV
jgi:phosphatidate cytidylyltransferase